MSLCVCVIPAPYSQVTHSDLCVSVRLYGQIYTPYIHCLDQQANPDSTHSSTKITPAFLCVSDMTWGCAVRGKIVIRLLH